MTLFEVTGLVSLIILAVATLVLAYVDLMHHDPDEAGPAWQNWVTAVLFVLSWLALINYIMVLHQQCKGGPIG